MQRWEWLSPLLLIGLRVQSSGRGRDMQLGVRFFTLYQTPL
jgi:hypothetical protein